MIEVSLDIILESDINEYLKWLFSQKEKTIVDIIDNIKLLVPELTEEEIKRHKKRFEKNAPYNKQWTAFTKEQYPNFFKLRYLTYINEKRNFENIYRGTALGKKGILINEYKRITTEDGNTFIPKIYNKQLIDNYPGLAITCGKIDYLKSIDGDVPFYDQSNAEVPRKLTQAQIALLYRFQNKDLNDQNAETVAKKYGHTSGDSLQNNFRESKDRLDFTKTNTRKRRKNLLKDIEAIEPLILDKNQKAYLTNYIDKLKEKLLRDD